MTNDEQEGVQLTPGGLKKLGNLVNIKDDIVANAIRERGGGQAQVNQLRSDYQNLKVGELANLAAGGDTDAETAIKILKQARKKRDIAGDWGLETGDWVKSLFVSRFYYLLMS